MRCSWATGVEMVPYHDVEWGTPVHDDRRHFELLTLEGAQAGLSWLTVLKRRDGYRRAFDGFDPVAVAAYDDARVEQLMADPGIIRHRQKITSTITNAAALAAMQAEPGGFDAWIWAFVGGSTIVGGWQRSADVPASTALSVRLSAELRRRGFRFVGPTVCYSYLQAAGLVNDHVVECFRYAELLSGDAAKPE
jgi:DNA-3-methyladenine glycosylase I